MSEPSVREQLVALPRRNSLSLAPVGIGLAFACVLAIAGHAGPLLLWAGLLAFGALMAVGIETPARQRDGVVLTRDDDTVRDYLRVRLDLQILRTGRIVIGLLVVPLILVGLEIVSNGGPAPWISAAQFFLTAAALLVTVVYRRTLLRASLRRQRAALGDRMTPGLPPQWLPGVAREVARVQSVGDAAGLWDEVTGIGVVPATAMVKSMMAGPEPPPPVAAAAGPPPGPPDGVVREAIQAMARRDLAEQAITFVILAALYGASEWGRRVDRLPDVTTSQQVYIAVAVFTLLAALAHSSIHGKALKGDEVSRRAYHRVELEKRLRRVSRWSPVEIALIVLACLFAASAVFVLGAELVLGKDVSGWPWLVESLIFVAWFIVMPFADKRRLRPRLQREQAELDAVPPLTEPVA